MARRNRGATREAIEEGLSAFKQSGLTRREYCEREGITLYMLDYYHRRLRQLRQSESDHSGQLHKPETRLARVEVRTEARIASASASGFALRLANGRRIEVNGWEFPDAALARLIEVAEKA